MSRPTWEQVARVVAEQMTYATLNERLLHERIADAVLALFPDPSTDDAEAEAECDVDECGFFVGPHSHAQQPREVVTTAADAWDEGYRAALDDAHDHAIGAPAGRPNPYRPEETP